MCDAMVHTDYRDPERARQRPGGGAGHTETGAEAGAHREGHQADVGEADACLVHRFADDAGDDIGMVVRRLPGMEPAFLGTEHVQLIGEDVAVVVDYPHAQRVGGTLDPQSYHATPDTLAIFEGA